MKAGILFGLLLCALTQPFAWSGTKDGGGGDFTAQDFVSTANELTRRLGKATDLPFSLTKLSEAIQTTDVFGTDEELTVAGESVAAKNYPDEKKIRVNRIKWDQAGFSEKMTFALHEYLGIMQVPDNKYQISASLTFNLKGLLDVRPREIVAESGSALAQYDREVKRMETLKDDSEGLEAAEKILKKWFGFTDVDHSAFASTAKVARVAKFYASELRSILPFNYSSQEFISLSHQAIASRKFNTERQFLLERVHPDGSPVAKNRIVLEIDTDKDFTQDLNTTGTPRTGQTFKITAGWGTNRMKILVCSILENTHYYFPNLDFGK